MKKGPPVIKSCGYCSVEFDAREKNKGKGIKRMEAMKYCSRGCMAKDRAKTHNQENHHLWKGGLFDHNGYKRINVYEGDGNRRLPMQHVDIMENHIGRKLEPDEIVHHIDRNRSNNELDNLQIMKRTDHSKLHYEEGDYCIGRYKYVA